MAHPPRTRRLRRHPVLPVHRIEMGHQQTDALRDLFNGRAWFPPSLEPSG